MGKRNISPSHYKSKGLEKTLNNIFTDLNLAFKNKRIKNQEGHHIDTSFEKSTEKTAKNTRKPLKTIVPKYPHLNKRVLRSVLKDLTSKRKKSKFERTCSEGYDSFRNLINWDSPSYTFRIIRNLILNRDWNNLKDVINILMHHKVIYKDYVKEITHLHLLINNDTIDPLDVEEYYQLCFGNVPGSNVKDFDIWYNEHE